MEKKTKKTIYRTAIFPMVYKTFEFRGRAFKHTYAPAVAKVMLILLKDGKPTQDGYYFLHGDVIAEFGKIKKRTVTNALKLFRELGLVRIVGKVLPKPELSAYGYQQNLYEFDFEGLNEFVMIAYNDGVNILEQPSTGAGAEFFKMRREANKQRVIDTLEADKKALEKKAKKDASPEEKDKVAKKLDDVTKRLNEKIREIEKAEKIEEDLLLKHEEILEIKDRVNTYGIKDKYITGGNKRHTNDLCLTLNESHGEKSTRHRMLRKHLGEGNYEEFDVNASIYRLTYNLRNDVLLDHSEDLYEYVFKRLCLKTNLPFSAFRKDWKKLFMPIYMKKGSVYYNMTKVAKLRLITDTTAYSKEDKDLVEWYDRLEASTGTYIDYLITSLVREMEKLFGQKSYSKYIFIHESNVHIMLLDYFQNELGLKCINVYDGFYFEEGKMSQKLFEESYDLIVNRYKQMRCSKYSEFLERDPEIEKLKKARKEAKKNKNEKNDKLLTNGDVEKPQELEVIEEVQEVELPEIELPELTIEPEVEVESEIKSEPEIEFPEIKIEREFTLEEMIKVVDKKVDALTQDEKNYLLHCSREKVNPFNDVDDFAWYYILSDKFDKIVASIQ